MRQYFVVLRVFTFGIVALAVANLTAITSVHAQAPGGPPPAVTVAHPLQKPVVDWDEFTGRFEAVDTVALRARVSGYITEVHFADGQIVKRGDLLFVIDPRLFEHTVARLKAELASTKVRFDYTKADLERAQPLRKNENISEQIFEQRKRDLGAAEAAVQAAEANLKSAELDLQFTHVKAPIDGRISRKLVGEGNFVTGASANGTLLTTIVSQTPIHFYFDLSEADYLKYARNGKTGQAAGGGGDVTQVLLALQDDKTYSIKGHLDFVDNRIDNATGTMRARAVFDNAQGLLTPGLFGRVRLSGSNEYSALLVPDEAINTDQTNRFVYVVGEDGTVSYKAVTPGPMVDGLRVIRGGIAPTDWVIIKGVQKARTGGKVAPQQSTIGTTPKQAALP